MAKKKTDPKTPSPEQDPKTGRFVAGNGGNGGRPKGSRNKLGEAFLSDMLEDWEANGKEAIAIVRAEKPDAYLKVVASILPKDINVNMNPLQELSDEDLMQRLRDLDEVIRPFVDPGRAGEATGSAAGAGGTRKTPLN